MIGTRGVPARYGGFETCVEEVGRRLAAAGHEVLVYCRPAGCRSRDDAAAEVPRHGAGASARRPQASLETLGHTALSVLHRRLAGADAAIVFNAGQRAAPAGARPRGIPVATHVDGLEWRRGKWGPAGRRYYRAAESLAVRWSDALIADAHGHPDYSPTSSARTRS